MVSRGWCIKFVTGIKIRIGLVQKVYELFCQNDSLIGEIILAKGQLDHSYTFWAMPIMIFSPVANLMHYPLGRSKRVQKCQRPFMDVPKGTKAVFKILLELTLKV